MAKACVRLVEALEATSADAKPSEIPVTQSTVFELVVNLKTARELGITVPQDVLLSANAVVQ